MIAALQAGFVGSGIGIGLVLLLAGGPALVLHRPWRKQP